MAEVSNGVTLGYVTIMYGLLKDKNSQLPDYVVDIPIHRHARNVQNPVT